MSDIDSTHDADRKSWVASANGHPDFPIQNLPFGIFSPAGQAPRGGVAIGDDILDLKGMAGAGLLSGAALQAAQAASAGELNAFLSLGAGSRLALRRALSELLQEGSAAQTRVQPHLHAAGCTLYLPARIGDYTDFYAGIHHATNVGKLFRPDNPLLPNYKHIPIGYHGRASSVRPSGFSFRRPLGQRKAPNADRPEFGPCERLDFELELGIWIGPGNALGEPIPIEKAQDHVAGYCLLNDWSARDIQAWEYQPLGPFLAKNFASVVSPWIVTPEALAPFRIAQPPRPDGDPEPLAYLLDPQDQAAGAFDLELQVYLSSKMMRERALPPRLLSRSNTRHMYWTVAQMVAHHASGGCNLNPGDLFGTGTISGTDTASCGSLLEMTGGGKNPISLAPGEQRWFLEDGDEVVMKVRAARDGFASIGFGDCSGTVLPAARGR